jgi:hypothetical protein
MGGTLGAAVFLSILFSVLPDKVKGAFTAASTTPEFQQAAAAHPDQMSTLRSAASGGTAEAFNDTSFINRLADALSHPFKVGFSESMSVVFLVGTGVMVIGLVVILFLPELPLRSMSAADQRAEEDAAAAAAAAAH